MRMCTFVKFQFNVCRYMPTSQKVMDDVVREWYFRVQEVILHIIGRFQQNLRDLPNMHANFEPPCVRISQKVVDGVLRKWYFLVQEVILHIRKFERNRKGPLNLHANLHVLSNVHICRYLKKLWTALLVNGIFVYRSRLILLERLREFGWVR